jgi:hypothetical protein
MLKRMMLVLAASLMAVPADAADLTGNWKLTAEGRIALLLRVEHGPTGGWRASATRPEGMAIDDGVISGMGSTASDRLLVDADGSGERLALRFEPPRPGEEQIRMLVAELDDDHAQLVFAVGGQQSQPMALVRAEAGVVVDRRWDRRRYRLDAAWPDNPEMERLFSEDQADRQDPTKIDWSVVSPRDEARKARTRALLADGKLRSGKDFHAAAFIFQHGGEPEDFLLAHSLAIAAVARGETGSTWIAAATLDRYLQSIGQPQIYGTQFKAGKGEKSTEGAYDRALVPDALRAVLGVPSLAEQDAQRRAWEQRMNAAP